MTWLKKHHRIRRIALLILLLVAFLGPWSFDLIYVPSEFECSAPFIRLSDDFCGAPLSGIQLYRWMAGGFIYSSNGVFTGEIECSKWIREFLFSLFLCLPLLPIFSTLLLILRSDHKRRQVFNVIFWILAIGLGLFWGLNNYPKLFWAVWGIWLYTGLAISALLLEIKTYSNNRKFAVPSNGGKHVLD